MPKITDKYEIVQNGHYESKLVQILLDPDLTYTFWVSKKEGTLGIDGLYLTDKKLKEVIEGIKEKYKLKPKQIKIKWVN